MGVNILIFLPKLSYNKCEHVMIFILKKGQIDVVIEELSKRL